VRRHRVIEPSVYIHMYIPVFNVESSDPHQQFRDQPPSLTSREYFLTRAPNSSPLWISFQRAKTSGPDACSKILDVCLVRVSQNIPITTTPYRRYLNVNPASSVRPYPIYSTKPTSPFQPANNGFNICLSCPEHVRPSEQAA
jgi:hypothetical protein